jgi:hypothetical protein
LQLAVVDWRRGSGPCALRGGREQGSPVRAQGNASTPHPSEVVRERYEASLMNPIETVHFSCPWCGKPAETAVDCTGGDQEYVEDCWSCCRPMVIRVALDSDGELCVLVSAEGE